MARLVLLTRSLERGGTERQVVNLACRLAAHGLDVHVVTMYGRGEFLDTLSAAGVPVHSLGKSGRRNLAGPFVRLVGVLRRLRPDVVYSFLAGANLAAVAAAPCAGRPVVVWGVREANGLRGVAGFDRSLVRVNRLLARRTAAIVCNSTAGLSVYARLGYPASRLRVVRNGVDPAAFSFDAAGRGRLRAAWSAAPDVRLVGIVGRPDPAKNHDLFLAAGAAVCAGDPSVRLVVVGFGAGEGGGRLGGVAAALGVAERIVWAGDRGDMAAVYSALDLLVSASRWEGCPNAVLEAMACGLPVVATAAGDTPLLLGAGAPLVRVDATPAELAATITRALAAAGPRPNAALVARARDMFDLERSVSETARVLRDLVRPGR